MKIFHLNECRLVLNYFDRNLYPRTKNSYRIINSFYYILPLISIIRWVCTWCVINLCIVGGGFRIWAFYNSSNSCNVLISVYYQTNYDLNNHGKVQLSMNSFLFAFETPKKWRNFNWNFRNINGNVKSSFIGDKTEIQINLLVVEKLPERWYDDYWS